MPGVRMHFEFLGDTQIDRTLTAFEERAVDARPAWEQMRLRFLAMERRQFSSEGSAGGQKWAPLSPKYAAWKANHYPGRPILVRTGEMKALLTDGPDINVQMPTYAVFGTNDPVAARHQRGTDRMPRRPVVAMPDSERRAWVRILQQWLTRGRL